MSFSTLIIVGNLGSDPELRYATSGTAVCSMNVASNRSYTDKDGQKVKVTTWFKVSAWGKQAENCAEYLHKGSSVLVEGELTPDKESGGPKVFTRSDGTSGAAYEVNAKEVRFLGGNGKQQQEDDNYF